MSKSTLKILPALIAAITAAWVAQPVYGDGVVIHQLVFTEDSSLPDGLSITYDTMPITVTFLPSGSPEVQAWTFGDQMTCGSRIFSACEDLLSRCCLP